MSDLYVDYMSGRSKWQRCLLSDVEKYRTETDFFITWQRYCNELQGEHGEIYGNWPFDFDHDTDLGIAQRDCIRVYDLLSKRINPKNIRLYFSGSKGFHLEIDYRAYMDRPAFDLHLIYRELAQKFERMIKPERNSSTLDHSIYSLRRMWRYPNTRHSKTGLFCIPLTADELRLPLDKIRELAKNPRVVPDHGFLNDFNMRKSYDDARTAYWKHVEDFEKRREVIIEYTGKYPPCVQKIFDEGLPAGTRNNTIYLLARFLKRFKNEEDLRKQLTDLAEKSFSGTGEKAEAKQIYMTITSALKREGHFLSCKSFTPWCDKEQCNLKSKKGSAAHFDRVDKQFNICSHQEAKVLLLEAIKRGEYQRAIRTGIGQLDMKTKILQHSVIIVASLSDVGKSSFAVTIIRNNPDKKILYLAIEEGRDMAELRLLRARVADEVNITLVTGQMGTITPDGIRSIFYTNSGKFDFVIIDQLVNLDEAGREERLKYKIIMQKFREMAREYKKPIFCLHQLNRLAKFNGAKVDQEPYKEQLAEGADIERLAHDVWLLYRKKVDKEWFNLLKIDKNKNYRSPIIVPLAYDFKSGIFTDFPPEAISWEIFGKNLNIDENEYFMGQVEEDIRI